MIDVKPQGDYRVLGASRYLVFGAARSGLAAAALLKSLGRECAALDEGAAQNLEAARRTLDERGIPFANRASSPADLDGAGAVILSPGIPATHPLLAEARRRGIGVYSEIELGFACCPAPIVAITGSNGKTTTTTLVAHMLSAAGLPSLVAGNIGNPLCAAAMDAAAYRPNAVLAVEVSSFQLETIDQFRPKAAIVTNITPDHLDRYGNSMDAYAAAKLRITANQTAEDALIVNQDDALCLSFLTQTKAQHWAFSTIRAVERGAYLSEEILLAGAGRARRIAALDDLPLPGLHNASNMLAACAAACFLRLPIKAIRDAALSAKAPDHRLQFTAEIDGVVYYNDSKATNVDAVSKALDSFPQPIILLAGGRDKNGAFEALTSKVGSKVKKLILFGEAAEVIERHWGSEVDTIRVPGMAEAVRAAREAACAGDAVLLSPACASFDQYPNYEARGRDFMTRVQSMKEGSEAP